MSNSNDGGRAFPTQLGQCDGMSLRDWFAGQALQALIARNEDGNVNVSVAYKVADAMLLARETTAREVR